MVNARLRDLVSLAGVLGLLGLLGLFGLSPCSAESNDVLLSQEACGLTHSVGRLITVTLSQNVCWPGKWRCVNSQLLAFFSSIPLIGSGSHFYSPARPPTKYHPRGPGLG